MRAVPKKTPLATSIWAVADALTSACRDDSGIFALTQHGPRTTVSGTEYPTHGSSSESDFSTEIGSCPDPPADAEADEDAISSPDGENDADVVADADPDPDPKRIPESAPDPNLPPM